MDDLRSRAYRAVTDEANWTLLVVAAAVALGVVSIGGFMLSGGGSVTQEQFALLVGAMVLIFYVLLRTSTFN